MSNRRIDAIGEHRTALEKNKKKILASQSICGICGKPVDKTLKYPAPMSATVDHIIPINRGGHPSDLDNLQLAHFICNRLKSDQLPRQTGELIEATISNRDLPWSMDWTKFEPKN